MFLISATHIKFSQTEKIIYCQSFCVDDISKEEEKSLVNAKRYIVMPGVVLADEIYVPTDNMKTIYMQILGELSGQNRKDWGERINVLPPAEESDSQERFIKEKLLFFCPCDCDYYSYMDASIGWLKRALENFVKQKGKIKILWVEEAQTMNNMKHFSKSMVQEYEALKVQFLKEELGEIISMEDAVKLLPKVSGYYGSKGYLMNLCVREKITVMLGSVVL